MCGEVIERKIDIPKEPVIWCPTHCFKYDTLESVERTRFHTKEEVEQRDAFAHLDMLIPCKENAFLLRER